MCMCVRALPQIENTAPKAAGLRGDCCLCRKMPSGRENVRRAFGYLFIDGQSGAIGLIFASANQTALQYDNGVIMKNPFQSPTTFAQEAR